MEDKFYNVNELNKALKGFFNNSRTLNAQNSNEQLVTMNQTFSPTPIPRRCYNHTSDMPARFLIKEKDLLLWSANSKSSVLLDEETSSGCGSAISSSNDTQNLLMNTLPPPYVSDSNVLCKQKTLSCNSTMSTKREKSLIRNQNRTQTLANSRIITNPRKPRQAYNTLKKSSINSANKNLYCFVNTSYALSSTPQLEINSQSSLLRSSNQGTLKPRQEMNSLQRERLQRPSAPPPPPPLSSDFGFPRLSSTPAPRIMIGFERLENTSTNPIAQQTTSKFDLSLNQKLNIRLKPVKNPIHFDWIVFGATCALFIICILAISIFQSQANQFYMRFINVNYKQSNLTESFSENDFLEEATGSDLVKQTILVCNGPWFSYQMNNLLVLPFSLILLITFTLLNKKNNQSLKKKFGKKSSSKGCLSPHLPSGLDPFQRRNRFLVAALFCILANEIFKMIESSMFVTPSSTFNSTSELFQSVYFVNNRNNTTENSSNSSILNTRSGADLLRIGLGIEPEQFAHQRNRAALFLSKTTKPPTTRSNQPNYTKPKLRPRLDVEDFKNDSRMIIDLRIDVSEHFDRIKKAHNKSVLVISSLNSTLQNSSSQTLFEFSMSLYQNQYIQSALHKLVESCGSNQLKWSLILSRLEKVGFIIVEVLVIGLRYYPIMSVLEMDNRLICVGLAAFYMWFDIVYNIAITGLCEGLRLNVSFELLKDIRAFFGVGSILDHKGLKNTQQIDARFLFSTKRIIYTTVKSLPHFFCLAYVTVRLSCVYVLRTCNQVKERFKRQKQNTNEDIFDRYIVDTSRTYDLVYTKAENKRHHARQWMELNFEDRYVVNLFNNNKKLDNQSFRLLDSNFRYSNRTVYTYTVCFTVLYYFTCFFCFYSSIFVDLIYFPAIYKHFLMSSALLTSFVCFSQLFLSLKELKKHLKSLYRGKLNETSLVLSPSVLSLASNNRKIATANFNFAGYAVTYTCWGYIILFILMSFLAFQGATLVVFGGGILGLTIFLIVLLLPIIISIALVKVMNRFIGLFAARFCFLQKRSKVLALKNARLYSLFLYFKFFYDCFAGIALCLLRIIKAFLISIVFMTRLDVSLMGHCQLDSGYMAYIGYVFWEAAHTNPVVIGFCDLLKRETMLREMMRREERRQANGLTKLTNKSSSGIRARTRWFLIYTLINNKNILHTRKKTS